jgi:hypothetical protein
VIDISLEKSQAVAISKKSKENDAKAMVLSGHFKMKISRRRPRLSPHSPEFIRDAFRLLEPILLAYSDQYRFRQKSIYLDSKTAPLRHIRSYYLLARLCEESHIKSVQVFSLHSSWLPGYVQIDTKILRLYFLHDNYPRMANKSYLTSDEYTHYLRHFV